MTTKPNHDMVTGSLVVGSVSFIVAQPADNFEVPLFLNCPVDITITKVHHLIDTGDTDLTININGAATTDYVNIDASQTSITEVTGDEDVDAGDDVYAAFDNGDNSGSSSGVVQVQVDYVLR